MNTVNKQTILEDQNEVHILVKLKFVQISRSKPALEPKVTDRIIV